MTLNPLRVRSLSKKLALLFLLVVGVSFAVIYGFVVPQLKSDLGDQKLDDLERTARNSSAPLTGATAQEISASELDALVRVVADSAGARITLLSVQESDVTGDVRLFTLSDSNEDPSLDTNLGLAERAVEERRIVSDAIERDGDLVGDVAIPLEYRGRVARVAVYWRSFEDVDEAVTLVRNRVLAATGFALLIAVLGSYLIARALARRVVRLERGAREMAAGQFTGEPLIVDSEDELGRLTHAFNDMREQLASLDRARREFIANASHELRTPIFSLAGFMELLQDEQLDEETRREFLATMNEQLDRLQKLAVDLLDLSRLDAGSLELHSEEVDLSELAHAVAGEFRPAVAQHRTELDLHLPGTSVQALCDRERVAQIMRIMLDNAIRHTPEGTRIAVRASREDGTVEFAVEDSGPGLEPAARTQVFDRFYTADAARGSGLGLAIAKELAERMDGRIRLHSRPGLTVFTLALPCLEGDADGDARRQDDRSAS
jgi:two-component system OmpR family sensor kinase